MDKLGVINMALLKCALPLADNLGDIDYNANFIFENVTRETLRAHVWSFAQKFAALTPSSQAPRHGFGLAYDMPADCIRLLEVRSSSSHNAPQAEFSLQGRLVFTNAQPCNARYIHACLDPELWPPDFTNAIAARLACEIAGLSAEKLSLVPQLLQLWQMHLNIAMANDSHEEKARMPLDDSLYANRNIK